LTFIFELVHSGLATENNKIIDQLKIPGRFEALLNHYGGSKKQHDENIFSLISACILCVCESQALQTAFNFNQFNIEENIYPPLIAQLLHHPTEETFNSVSSVTSRIPGADTSSVPHHILDRAVADNIELDRFSQLLSFLKPCSSMINNEKFKALLQHILETKRWDFLKAILNAELFSEILREPDQLPQIIPYVLSDQHFELDDQSTAVEVILESKGFRSNTNSQETKGEYNFSTIILFEDIFQIRK